jgi:hypothetical protein
MTRLNLGHLRAALPFAAVAALAGCVPPPAPPPPAPTPTPAPAPQPTAAPPPVEAPTYDSWVDVPATPGDWYYQATATGGAARFGQPQTEARFSMVCDRTTRTVSLVRSGSSPVAVQMRIRTEMGDRLLDAVPSGGQLPTLVASLSAYDPFLEAMAFSKGRFAVEVQGLDPLYLPAWPEVTRVIEDCR